MKYILLPLLVLSNILFSSIPEITSLENKQPERILFIGNSYLYYNDSLHNHVRRMLNEFYLSEINKTNYKSVTISGSRLSHHNVDYSLSYKNIGVQKPFQLVIVQGGSGETDTSREREIFANELDSIVSKIHKSGAEAALYMIHAYVEPHLEASPQMIEDIKKMYVSAGNKNNALVIPVGIAFQNAYKQRPSIQLHKHYDGSHPSLLGTYLASLVVFACITHISPMEIKYSYFDKVDNEQKKFLQNVAHETVENFYNIDL